MCMISICCMHFRCVYSTNKHESSAQHTSLQQMAQYSPIATGLTNSHTPSLCFLPPLLCQTSPALFLWLCPLQTAVQSESCGKAALLSLSHLYINCDGDSVLTVNRLPPESSRKCHFQPPKTSCGRTGCTDMHAHTPVFPLFIKTHIRTCANTSCTNFATCGMCTISV